MTPRTTPERQGHSPESVTEPRFSLTPDADVIAHVVCCREASWEVAFCGEVNDVVALNATTVCTLCVEVARSRRPGWDPWASPPICPLDGDPCPDEHEIDLRILREVTP